MNVLNNISDVLCYNKSGMFLEYGICLNKEPDYLVGLESGMENSDDIFSIMIKKFMGKL